MSELADSVIDVISQIILEVVARLILIKTFIENICFFLVLINENFVTPD